MREDAMPEDDRDVTGAARRHGRAAREGAAAGARDGRAA
jgi:hypothetical protein